MARALNAHPDYRILRRLQPCLDWPAALGHSLPNGEAYGKIVRVELLHKLHGELKYDGLDALTKGIAKDCDDARTWLAARSTERPDARI